MNKKFFRDIGLGCKFFYNGTLWMKIETTVPTAVDLDTRPGRVALFQGDEEIKIKYIGDE